MKPRILFLVPAEYDALRRKGVDRMILERDEGGFFERVVTVHPLGSHQRTIDLDAVHRIHEFALGRALGSGVSSVRARLTAPFMLLTVFHAVVRIARAERINLVRANDPYLMGLLGWRVSRKLGVPFCVSVHAAYAKSFELAPKRGVADWLRRFAGLIPPFVIPRADMVLPISKHLVQDVERAGGRQAAIRIIPHGIDIAPFTNPPAVDARALFGVPGQATVISWVSRMSGENYSDEVADVVERLVRRRPGVVFVLVGEGPNEIQLRHRLLDRPQLAAAVRILPFQSYDRVVALRRISAVSLCLIGGFSLLEACAAGSPVVAYDVDWHREIVQDGLTGFLVKEHDVNAVVAALEQLVDDPVTAAAMGRRAQRTAFARHDIRATSQIKQNCYQELLDARAPRG